MENATESEDPIYRNIHGYLSVIICSIGIMLNIVNILAWSRKDTVASDVLLSALGVTDGFSLLSYLIYSAYFFLITGPGQNMYHSERGMYVVVVGFHSFLTFHMFSNFLTLSLAIIRYFHVCRGYSKFCETRFSYFIIMFGLIVTVLVALPFYFYYEIYDLAEESESGYWIMKSDFAREHVYGFQVPLLWIYGVIFKLIPCVLMIILSGSMVNSIRRAKKRKDQLTNRSIHRKSRRNCMEYNRTTLMLLMIVVIYVLTETPIAISAFLSGLQRAESHFFYFLLYSTVGDILDLLTVLNASANFFVYITMCTRFRRRIRVIFSG